MSDKILIDTNVLIYCQTSDDPEKNNVASTAIARHENYVVSLQNLVEFSSNMTKKSKLSHEQINDMILNFEAAFGTISFGSETIKEANRISRLYSLHFFDALLAATMQENGINSILTENERDFRKIPELTIINPFK